MKISLISNSFLKDYMYKITTNNKLCLLYKKKMYISSNNKKKIIIIGSKRAAGTEHNLQLKLCKTKVRFKGH